MRNAEGPSGPGTDSTAPDDDLVGRPKVDPAKLPALLPQSSKGWDRRLDPRRWYVFGCSAAAVLLVVVMVTAYFGLKGKVWRSFDETLEGVSRCVLVDVPEVQRKRLEANLEAFRLQVESSGDPYAAIGRFVGLAREAVADWAVDTTEVEQLNTMLEAELGRGNIE